MPNVMMEIRVSQIAAIELGRSQYGTTSVPVPVEQLTPEERTTLVSMPTQDLGFTPYAVMGEIVKADVTRLGLKLLSLPAVGDTSLESIKTLLAAYPLVRADAIAKEAALVDKCRQIAKEAIELPIEQWMRPGTRFEPFFVERVPESVEQECRKQNVSTVCINYFIKCLPEVEEHLRAVKAEVQRRNETLRAEQIERKSLLDKENEQKAARNAARNAERQSRMMAWAKEHGSTTLQKMIAHEVGDWTAVAENEFYKAKTPEGYTEQVYNMGEDTTRNRPTEQEIDEFVAAKALCAACSDVYSEPSLVLKTVKHEDNDDYDDDDDNDNDQEQSYGCLHLTITAPTGNCITVGKIITAINNSPQQTISHSSSAMRP